MKKLLPLIITLFLALNLCACGIGSDDVGGQTTPNDPTGSSDAGMDATESTPGATDETESSSEATHQTEASTEATEKPISLYQRWIDRMTGEWFALDAEKDPAKTCTVSSDGTIDIDGEVYKIRMTTMESWDWASLTFIQNDSKVYEGRVDLEEDGSISMGIRGVGTFYLVSQYDVVTLTAENWLDYFEQGTYVYVHKNDFQEVDFMDVDFYYSVKKEYAAVNINLSSAAIEYTYKVDTRNITSDPGNGTFTVGDVIEEHDPGSEMRTMTNIQVSNDRSKLFGFTFYEPRLTDFAQGYTRRYTYYTFDQVLRITGTLYIYNGNAK